MTIHNRYLTILAIAVPIAADVPSCAALRDIIKYLYYANSGMEAYLGQLQWLWGFNFPFFIFVYSTAYSVDTSFEGIKYTDIKHGGVVLHNGGWNHDCVYVVGWWPVYCPGQYPLSRPRAHRRLSSSSSSQRRRAAVGGRPGSHTLTAVTPVVRS